MILTQQERSMRWLATQSGINHQTLSRKLSGQVSFTADELLAIAPVLNTTAAAIVKSADQELSAS